MNAEHKANLSVDITNCDSEPIHVLGTIQPFGFLITVSADWLISRVSTNTQRHLGIPFEALIGKPLSNFLLDDALHAIRNRITMLRDPDAVERLFAVKLRHECPPFDVAVHFSGQSVVIEGEPAMEDQLESATLVRSMIARLNKTDSMATFLREGARHVVL